MKIISLENQSSAMGDDVEEVVDAMNELLLIGETETLEQLDSESAQLVADLGIISEVKASIEAHGVTPAIESIFGESLISGGISLDNKEVACEGIMDSAKAILRKIWEFIMKMVSKVKDFFAKRFGKFAKYEKALKQRSKVLIGADAKVLKTKDAKGENNVVKSASFGKKFMQDYLGTGGTSTKALVATVSAAGTKGKLDPITSDSLMSLEVEEDVD